MNKSGKLLELRHSLATYALPEGRLPRPLGAVAADQALGGGLCPGSQHEVFADDWGAGGFALCLALLAAGHKPLFWVRPDYEAMEYGALSPMGLLELGGDPARLVQVRAPHPLEALAVANDILACPHVGALVLELSGAPKALDLVASRRLGLSAAQSGVSVILLREGAAPTPSAALTRWQVRSAPSASGDYDWGAPRFAARLVRHRLGATGEFLLQWNPRHVAFHDAHTAAAHPRPVVHASARRPARTG